MSKPLQAQLFHSSIILKGLSMPLEGLSQSGACEYADRTAWMFFAEFPDGLEPDITLSLLHAILFGLFMKSNKKMVIVQKRILVDSADGWL